MLCSTDSQYHGTTNLYMLHHHVHSNILLLCASHSVSCWWWMYHRELSAKRTMEYDLRQYPCVCVAVSISSPRLLLLCIYYYHYYHPSTNILLIMHCSCSQDMEVWILTLIIYDLRSMTKSCSQVCGCRRSLLSPCYALHRWHSAPMLLLCGPLQSRNPGLHPWFRPCVRGVRAFG